MTGKDDARRPDQYNTLKLQGSYVIKVRDKDGKLIHYDSGKNLITNNGEKLVAQLLDFNGTENPLSHLAFGSGTVGALKTDTQLQSEIAGTRDQVDSTNQTTNTLQMIWAVTAGGAYTIREMGIFNALVIGTMMSRFITQPLSVISGTTIDITWTLTISGID